MKKLFILTVFAILVLSCQTYNKNAEDGSVRQLPTDVYSPTHSDLARKYYNTGVRLQTVKKNYMKAIEAYLKAIELDNQYTDALDNVGVCYRILGDYENAKKYYKMSLDILPENDVALMNLALVHKITGEYQKSIELYNRLIETDPDNPEGYYGLGDLYYNIKEYKKSIVYMHKAIEKYSAINSPYIYDAYVFQGSNYFELENWEESLFYLEEVLAQYPNDKETQERVKFAKEMISK